MKSQKTDFYTYSSPPEIGEVSRSTNIADIIKKNRVKEKQEKLNKFYFIFGFSSLLFLVSAIIIYL